MNIPRRDSLNGASPNPSALVIGNGLTASIVVAAINNLGINTTQSELGSKSTGLFRSCDNGSLKVFNDLFDKHKAMPVETLTTPLTQIVVSDNGFRVTFRDRSTREFSCVFVATEAKFKPLPEGLTDGITVYTPGSGSIPTELAVCFLLDLGEITNPSIGMSVMRVALENQLAGGKSFVALRHTPVKGLFGETLYEKARLNGVRFFRYGDELPRIEPVSKADEVHPSFRVSIRDVIEWGEDFSFTADRVFVAVNPVGYDIPDKLKDLLSHETDLQGFLIQDSVHCATGKSFRRGLYCVGPSTGCVDLIATTLAATATAVDVASWQKLISRPLDSDGKMSVTDQCVRCLTCLRLCPHSAITLNPEPSKSSIKVSESRCVECGICVAECPRTALDLNGFPEESFSSLMSRIKGETPSNIIVVFGCYRSAGHAISEIIMPQNVIFFPVSCAGRLSEPILSASLRAGAKGVLILGCHHGNCRSNNGTDWAASRIQTISSKLSMSFQGRVSISYKTIAANEPARMLKLIMDFSKVALAPQIDGQQSVSSSQKTAN